MKITFTREEVEEIVLAHVQQSLSADLNHVALNSYAYNDFAVVTQETQPDAVDLGADVPVAEGA